MRIGEAPKGDWTAHHVVSAWVPTMQLRFVRRQVAVGEMGSFLQQKFQDVIFGATEWRDVPLETEGA